MIGDAWIAKLEATLMTLPAPWATMWRPAARVARKVPRRLVARTRSHSAADWSSSGVEATIPELLTSTSTRPKVSTVAATIRSTADRVSN